MSEQLKGPQSYFPAIVAKYQHPVEHWFTLLALIDNLTHMQQVAFLKNDHSMGHGHANALVAYFRARQA